MSTLKRAREIGASTTQTYGGKPYLVHLNDVTDVLDRYLMPAYTDPLYQVAFLHDAIEDIPRVTADFLAEEGFSKDVITGVQFCTDEDGPNRKTRKRLTYLRMRGDVNLAMLQAPHDSHGIRMGVRVKMADRIANMQASLDGKKEGLLQMYLDERDPFLLALYSPFLPEILLKKYQRLMLEAESLLKRIESSEY